MKHIVLFLVLLTSAFTFANGISLSSARATKLASDYSSLYLDFVRTHINILSNGDEKLYKAEYTNFLTENADLVNRMNAELNTQDFKSLKEYIEPQERALIKSIIDAKK